MLSFIDRASYNAKESCVVTRLESSLGNLINLKHEPMQLVFKNVSISCGSQLILHNVFGKANPGEILAIMGPSGSGKTTLLKGLSGRISTNEGSSITLNGDPLKKDHKHRLAVVEQLDSFKPMATLRQTLRLHAKLRLPSSLTNQQKLEYMDHFAKALDLTNLLDTTMGDVEVRGLSGGELKRANIACEMLSNPSLLFVDEPTSGLDSVHALNVIKLLKSYAVEYNRTVVVTVHQPSSRMFQLFDKLLLLCEGKMAYFGDRSKVVERLQELQMNIGPHYNPADFIMDQLYLEENKQKLLNAAEYPRGFYDSDENENDESASKTLPHNKSTNGNLNTAMEKGSGVQMLVTMDPRSIPSKPSITLDNGDSGRSSMLSSTGHSSSASLENLWSCDKWPISVAAQTRHLIWERYLMDSLKNHAKGLNWIHSLVFAIIVAVVCIGIKKEEKFVADINGWIFFKLAICMLTGTFNYLSEFARERHVINRERVSGMYCLCAYYIAKTVTSLPIMQLQFVAIHIVTHHVWDFFNLTTSILELLLLLLGVLFTQSVGVFINALCHDVHRATVISSLFAIPNLLLGGVFVNHLPWYIYWLKYLSPTHYTLQAIKIVEFTYGNPIRCAATNSIYAACNGNATFIPPSDLISDGTEVFPTLLPNILLLLSGSGVFLVLGYLALRFYKSPTNAI